MSEELIISGARVKQAPKGEERYETIVPHLGKVFDLQNFQKYILNSQVNFIELQEKIKEGKAAELNIRFNIWRILLGVFGVDNTPEEKFNLLQQSRKNYQILQQKYPKEGKKPLQQDPLKNMKQPHSNQFEINDLRSDIKKDVDRTYQSNEMFQKLLIKTLLSNLLFIWSRENSSLSYRQGINEICGAVIIVYFGESLLKQPTSNDEILNQQAFQFNDLQQAEADIYTVFEKIMNNTQHMEMFRPSFTDKQKQMNQSKKANAILARCSKIQDVYLKQIDTELFKHLKIVSVECQVFLLRWIRCLFTREFHLDDSFIIWDAIFLDFHLSDCMNTLLIDAMTLSMMIYVRDDILKKDEQGNCLQRFLKYPPIENIMLLLSKAYNIKQLIIKPNEQVSSQTDLSTTCIFFQDNKTLEQSNQDTNVQEIKQIKTQENIKVTIPLFLEKQNEEFKNPLEKIKNDNTQQKNKQYKDDKTIQIPYEQAFKLLNLIQDTQQALEQSLIEEPLKLRLDEQQKYLKNLMDRS